MKLDRRKMQREQYQDRRSRPRPQSGRFKAACDAAYHGLRRHAGAARAVLCVALLFNAAGCLKIPGKGNVPGRQATPLETALAYNATLAQTNQYVAEGVIKINEVSPNLLPTARANTILTAQSKIADADRQLTGILRAAAGAASPAATASILQGNSQRIHDLLAAIQKAGQELISSGDIGVKNPVSQQTFTADFNAMLGLGTAVMDTLISAQLIK